MDNAKVSTENQDSQQQFQALRR